jgi:acyl-CoA thioester hydrolase
MSELPPRRRKGDYFPAALHAPAPLVVRAKRRIRFSDVDPMGVVWHGRYAKLFEEASEELGRLCGMGYAEFCRDGVMAPIVQFHVDHLAPLVLGEEATTIGRLVWSDEARLNIEYEVHKDDGQLAAAGYTVQMFVDLEGRPLLASPPLYEACRKRWLGGEFRDLR